MVVVWVVYLRFQPENANLARTDSMSGDKRTYLARNLLSNGPLYATRVRNACACHHFDTTLPAPKPSFSLESRPQNYDRLNVMRKVWMYKRRGIKGWWVGWYESGKRRAKALPSKALAEHYRQIKYTQLNSDVFTGTVTVDWQQMRKSTFTTRKYAPIRKPRSMK